jgi:beta-aspartyl-peptidase (threonine type)
VLTSGGTALDACLAASDVLEDDPAFDAGTGSVLNIEGAVEVDAGVMLGQDLSTGAVCAARGIRHAAALAELVRTRTPHTLLAGAGADAFADECGVPRCAPEELVTDRERAFFKANRDTYNGNVGKLMGRADGGEAATLPMCVFGYIYL